MTRPETDDLLLFGFIGVAAVGVLFAALAITEVPMLALGLALIAFGAPSAVLILLAAGDNP